VSMDAGRVLVVDDEAQIQRALASILTAHGYTVDVVGDGAEAVRAATRHRPDLILLDLTLPDTDGIELCRELRTWLDAPVMVLSARTTEDDKIEALDAGADDYITKPFAAGEMLARVRALMRRGSVGVGVPAVLVFGDLEIDLAKRRVAKRGAELTLTRTEFDILALLAGNAGRVMTSRAILESVWGPEYADDRHTLRVHVSNLRKKVEDHPSVPRFILTEPGVGFLFCND